MAYHVNQVWSYCNELSFKILEKEHRFVSAYKLDTYTAGAVKEGYGRGAGSVSEDSRGHWHLNICVKTKKVSPIQVVLSSAALGIDQGLKSFAADSEGNTVEAQRFYRDIGPKIAYAQRAGKVGEHCAIFHARAAALSTTGSSTRAEYSGNGAVLARECVFRCGGQGRKAGHCSE